MNEDRLEIATRPGRVRGVELPAHAGRPAVRAWRGMPYAAAPVGALRWRPPEPPEAWTGVRPALDFGPDPLQAPMPASAAASQSEDCLHINVWAPAQAAQQPLPVMVWLHGGGFVGGSGADRRADGARLAARGVVVVSFNYRSGLFGYLAHPALSAESASGSSGNYGLLDQIAALRWVQDNIAGFGGDASRITVFGVSAGSASIALMLVCPATAGLFHRAILHSPGTARPLATLADAERAGRALGDDLEALRRLPAAELFALTPRLVPAVRGLTTPRVLRPIRDGVLIPQDERPAFLAGRLPALPLIVGTNADEGSLLTRSWPVRSVAEHRALMQANFPGRLDEALRHYGASDDTQALPRVAEAFADTQFNVGARLLGHCMARQEPRVWRYVFTRRRPGQLDGPHHGDEVAYVFGQLAQGRGQDALPFDPTDVQIADALASAWVSFARDADPGAPTGVEWPRFDAAQDRHLEFGDHVIAGSGYRRAALDFLDAIALAA